MSAKENFYFELLPIEIHLFHLQDAEPLKPEQSLVEMASLIEQTSLQPIRSSLHQVLQEDNEEEYLKICKEIANALRWLEYLSKARKEILQTDALPKNEVEALEHIKAQLQAWSKQLTPCMHAVLQKREKKYKDVASILKKTIDFMEEQTTTRAKKIFLDFQNIGNDRYAPIQANLDHFFAQLRAHADPILRFIQPNVAAWNAKVLSSGRGFLIPPSGDLPCSILFSLKGQCRLIFEDIGHLLGYGADKLVFRSICLPQGEVQALIQPLTHKESPEINTPSLLELRKKDQLLAIWSETELLYLFKKDRGIISIHERMFFDIEGEKKLFLVEDYYWDGSLGEYLKYAINGKIEAAKLPPNVQREVISDHLHGLAAVHQHQIVHHDMKPHNILLDMERKQNKAVLADFHQATHISNKEKIPNLAFLPIWAPPEYARIPFMLEPSDEELIQEQLLITTGKLDVWGLGVTFYMLIGYELPFWIQKMKAAGPPLDEIEVFRMVAELPKGWLPDFLKASPYFSLLEKMLEPDPKDRCTALEALEILKSLGE